MINIIKNALRKVGLQVKKYPDRDLKSRQTAMKRFGINKILDVGANTGQFAMELRNYGFREEIVSFEPLSSAYKELEKNAKRDRKWTTRNLAIGDSDGEISINVSKNSQSSSILPMLPAHLQSAPQSAYISQEKVKIAKVDTLFDDYYRAGDKIMLKIDTQGYEKNVIDGAKMTLSRIKGIKLEMSLIPLYEDELLIWDMVKYVERMGFMLYSLENTYADPLSGQLLQVDGTFYK